MKAPQAPGPKGNILFSRSNNWRSDAHLYMHEMEKQYGDISHFRFGPFSLNLVSNPTSIEYVLKNRAKYRKVEDGSMLRILLGNGLLTSEGDFWLKQRRLIQPIFHRQRLQGFAQTMVDSVEKMLSGWQTNDEKVFDIYPEITQLALDIAGKTLLSTDIKGDFNTIRNSLGLIMLNARRRSRLLPLPLWVPLSAHRIIQQNKKILNDLIIGIINARREDTHKFDDLLSMLMDVEDADTAERFSNQQLLDEVLTLIVAGHETTANAMSFAFYLLAKHPEAKQRIAEEVNTVFHDSNFNSERLPQLEFTTRVIKEVLRLYPPAWIVARGATSDDVIDGYRIKKGKMVVISAYAMHHSDRYWDAPEEFDPNRILPERIKDVPKFAYLPFGGGPRICIGNNFAMMEMQIILSKICPLYNFSLPEGFELELLPLVTLRPKNGVLLKMTRV